jgi:hypothetical protein
MGESKSGSKCMMKPRAPKADDRLRDMPFEMQLMITYCLSAKDIVLLL